MGRATVQQSRQRLYLHQQTLLPRVVTHPPLGSFAHHLPDPHRCAQPSPHPRRAPAQIGDASAGQSPLSFGGFGSMMRHLGRLSGAIGHALRDNKLTRTDLGWIQPYQPSLSASWLFQRSMSIAVGQVRVRVRVHSPHHVCPDFRRGAAAGILLLLPSRFASCAPALPRSGSRLCSVLGSSSAAPAPAADWCVAVLLRATRAPATRALSACTLSRWPTPRAMRTRRRTPRRRPLPTPRPPGHPPPAGTSPTCLWCSAQRSAPARRSRCVEGPPLHLY